MAELIDVFDGNHKKLGALERKAVHEQGLWHQTFHCWITGERSGFRFVLLQLRSASKRNYPNMLDITAAGHLAAGEEPIHGIRELKEELGLSPDAASLRPLGIKHDVADEPNGLRNREFAHVYLLREDRDMDGYRLQEDEVSGLVEVNLSEGLRLFSGEIASIDCRATRIENEIVRTFVRSVCVGDLIPRVDNYCLKVFMMAQIMLDGGQYLCI